MTVIVRQRRIYLWYDDSRYTGRDNLIKYKFKINRTLLNIDIYYFIEIDNKIMYISLNKIHKNRHFLLKNIVQEEK